MGGYAAYVWGSYAVVALCLIVECLAVRARRKRALSELRRVNAAALEGRA
jgi:heme exporter protein CcmD